MSNKAKIQGVLMNCSQKSVIGWSVEESDFKHVAEEIIKKLRLCDVIPSVLCIDNNTFGGLTVGKKYEIIKEDRIHYTIKNDFDSEFWYLKNLFTKN